MADPEHLKALEKGVDAWDEWHKINYKPDLWGAQLANASLSGADFSDTTAQSGARRVKRKTASFGSAANGVRF